MRPIRFAVRAALCVAAVAIWLARRAGADIPTAQRTLGDEIRPIDDVRSTALYRRRVAQNLLERFWTDTA